MTESEKLSSLSVFRKLLSDNVISKLLYALENPTPSNFGDFAYSLYENTDNLTEYILGAVNEDENKYMRYHARMEEVPEVIDRAAHEELKILENIAKFTVSDAKELMNYDGYLAGWNVDKNADFIKSYAERMANLRTEGYGIYYKYYSFMLRDGKITPVKTPDPQRLSELTGYDSERQKVIDNTLALLNGKPAANALLYGDAGTGKSSTVKAVLNEYKDKGLRLIEMKKSELSLMPLVIEKIADNPLKFIIFIDDLSFSYDDDNFGALKAVLEGSSAAKTPNTVIYATSNRRHLVKEKYTDRTGDELHARDSMEELTSLSERFGLKVTFIKPQKELYLKIVESLADKYNLDCDKNALFAKAEAFALRRSGRSGRAAKQFIEMVISGQIQI